MQKIDHKLFINILKANGITQKAFAEYAKIPYDTVTGWKKKRQGACLCNGNRQRYGISYATG